MMSGVTMKTISSFVKGQESKISWPFKMGPIGCPETSVMNYHYFLRNKA